MTASYQDSQAARLALCCAAAAHAEGWWVPGAVPRRNHNPGDIMDHAGRPQTFSDPLDGWRALVREWQLILSGTSGVYKVGMTWRRVAQLWTGGDNPNGWCAAFCEDLGVDPDSTVTQFLNPQLQRPPDPPAAPAGAPSPPAQPDQTAA